MLLLYGRFLDTNWPWIGWCRDISMKHLTKKCILILYTYRHISIYFMVIKNAIIIYTAHCSYTVSCNNHIFYHVWAGLKHFVIKRHIIFFLCILIVIFFILHLLRFNPIIHIIFSIYIQYLINLYNIETHCRRFDLSHACM